MRSSSNGVADRPCDAASEPAAAGAGLTGGVLGPFQNLTRRAKRRPATRAANSAQSWRRMALRFGGVPRGGGLQCSGGVRRGGGVLAASQECGGGVQQQSQSWQACSNATSRYRGAVPNGAIVCSKTMTPLTG